MSQISAYTYSTLDTTKQEIRLIALQPAAKLEDPIRVHLHISSLPEDRSLCYEALSYAWGDGKAMTSIEVEQDGPRALEITCALDQALRHLRHSTFTRLLWIDQICIDQTNVAERGEQVLLMGSVYRSAARVVVWLGLAADDSDHVFDLFRQLSSKFVITLAVSVLRYKASFDESDYSLGEVDRMIPYSTKELIAIDRLLHRAWFDRLWIRQEISFAAEESSTMQCGRSICLWKELHDAVAVLLNKKPVERFPEFEPSPDFNPARFKDRLQMIDRIRARPGESGLDLFVAAGDALCSNERDRIYGLLNLYERKEGKILLKPNYESPILEVYTDFFDKVKRLSNRIDFVIMSEGQKQRAGWPTWLPDLKQAFTLPVPPAAADMDVPAAAEIVQGGVLRAKAVYVDKIKSCRPFVFASDDDVDEFCAKLRANAPDNVLTADTQDGTSLLRDYFNTLITFVAGRMGTAWQPRPGGDDPIIEMFRQILAFDHDPHFDDLLSKFPGLEGGQLKRWCTMCRFDLRDITVSQTEKHAHLVKSGQKVQPGDQIFVILGLATPVLLRSVAGGRYALVGRCFIRELADGRAVLGPLREPWKKIVRNDMFVFHNTETSEVMYSDPRRHALEAAVKARGKQAKFRGYFGPVPEDRRHFSAEIFEEHGTKLQTIEIV